jgi:hypothetical protein
MDFSLAAALDIPLRLFLHMQSMWAHNPTFFPTLSTLFCDHCVVFSQYTFVCTQPSVWCWLSVRSRIVLQMHLRQVLWPRYGRWLSNTAIHKCEQPPEPCQMQKRHQQPVKRKTRKYRHPSVLRVRHDRRHAKGCCSCVCIAGSNRSCLVVKVGNSVSIAPKFASNKLRRAPIPTMTQKMRFSMHLPSPQKRPQPVRHGDMGPTIHMMKRIPRMMIGTFHDPPMPNTATVLHRPVKQDCRTSRRDQRRQKVKAKVIKSSKGQSGSKVWSACPFLSVTTGSVVSSANGFRFPNKWLSTCLQLAIIQSKHRLFSF